MGKSSKPSRQGYFEYTLVVDSVVLAVVGGGLVNFSHVIVDEEVVVVFVLSVFSTSVFSLSVFSVIGRVTIFIRCL